MTPKQIADEIEFIKKSNDECIKIINSNSDIKTKAEYREILRENNHQLMCLESTLISIKYDPLF